MVEQLLCQEDKRTALRRLRMAAKEEHQAQIIREEVKDGAVLEPFLKHSDAKVRKNTAALLGDLGIKAAACALYHAYETEETLFVRGTLLKALGQTNPYPYLDRLKERYDLLCGMEPAEDEKKHVREELQELGRILRREGEKIRHTFHGWEQRHSIVLTTNPQYAALTAEKFTAYKKKNMSLGVCAVVDNLKEVIDIRTFRELLFPIRFDHPVNLSDGPEAFGAALSDSKMLYFLERCHKEAAPFYFRIDIKSKLSLEERSRYTRRAAAVIEEKTKRKLINAPDDYEFEVRLLLDKEEKIHVFLKMFTIPMERFSYRKKTIAASIQPSNAAMLLELARPYLKENAQILDPCCGVGTMLIERHKMLPAREIYGIDLFAEAVAGARENTTEAKMRVNLIQKDFLEFEHRYYFDEIIANMPMRGKRTKEEQDLFYEKFFHKSLELLAPEGILILYSNENGFVKKQLRLHPKFRLCKEYLIHKKEQFWLFIIALRKNS